MGIRYRYALNTTGDLVDIQEMERAHRAGGAPFSCISCERELVPALGDIRVHYFRHKQEQDCSSETYRHQLAKRVFAATYERCLRERLPFHLIRTAGGRCSFYQEQFGFTCERVVTQRYDLTRWFERVNVEAGREGYRADVLLWSEKHDNYVFVEMAVTHRCEPEKQKSGIRIVEVAIETENDALAFRHPEIDADASGVELYNLKDEVAQPSCGGTCNRPVSMFVVYPNGSAVVQGFSASQVAAPDFLSKVAHKELFTSEDEDGWRLFRRKVREVHFSGTRVQHCFICRFHGVDRLGKGIWCKVKKRLSEPNEGAKCDIFKPLRSPMACEQADAAGEQFLQRALKRRREKRETLRSSSRRDIGLAARPSLPRRAAGGRARIHWSGSVLLESMRHEGRLLAPPGSPWVGRVIDYYLPQRVWYRRVVRLAYWFKGQSAFAALWQSDVLSPLPLAFIEVDDPEALESAVQTAFDAWLASSRSDAVIDSPMDWEVLPDGEPPMSLFPLRYRWSMVFRRWELDPRDADHKWGE